MSILDFRLLGIKNWSMTNRKMYIDIWKNEAESYTAISSNEFESRGIYLRSYIDPYIPRFDLGESNFVS